MKVLTSLALLAVTAAALPAQTNAPAAKPTAAPAPAPSEFEQFVQKTKKPVSWLTWGGDFRPRNEYYNNIITLTDTAPRHEQDVIRFRTRVWATATPFDGLSLNARVSAEPRLWMKPSFSGNFRNDAGEVGQQGMEWRYGIADMLNAKWTNSYLAITAGRQDVFFGDPLNWWLVADGTPGDGSWTFFLDSARVTLDVKDIKTRFDLVAIYQSARPDSWLPTIGDSDPDPPTNPAGYALSEQNEAGVILYASNKSLKNTQIDAYFIYKGDSREFANGDNADIYTLGARATGTFGDHWQYYLEGAYQFGSKEDVILGTMADRDLSAFGGNSKLSYLFKDKLKNQASVFFEYLSGDDPGTAEDEMFDILWGRWPRFSELYIYSYVVETSGKIAQVNNLMRPGLGWTLNPLKNTTAQVNYSGLFAPEDTPTRALNPAVFSQDGSFRGHYLQSVLRHTFNKHVNAHLWAEFVWEGDYYAQRDTLTFLRGEVLFTW